jgi:hypothetical protein
MVLYDDKDRVPEHSVGHGQTLYSNKFIYPKISTSAGGYVFENVSFKKPDTLFSPIDTLRRLIVETAEVNLHSSRLPISGVAAQA